MCVVRARLVVVVNKGGISDHLAGDARIAGISRPGTMGAKTWIIAHGTVTFFYLSLEILLDNLVE